MILKKKHIILIIILAIIIISVIIIGFLYNKKEEKKLSFTSKSNNNLTILLENEDGNIQVSSFPEQYGKYEFDKVECENLNTSTTSKAYTWNKIKYKLELTLSSSTKVDGQLNCNVYFKEYEGPFGKDESGANPPTDNHLLPVYYDDQEGTWKITSSRQQDWYNYNNKVWANAISIRPDRAIDYSGHCNLGTVSGPTRNDDYFSFDGSNDYISTTINPATGSNITLSARVYLNGATARGDIICSHQAGGVGIIYRYTEKKFVGNIYIAGNYIEIYTSNTVSQNTWYNVTFTYDGTNLKIYLNGILDNTVYYPGSSVKSEKNLYIGAQPAASGIDYPFKGYISNAVIYDKALTAEEIEHYYSEGSWGYEEYPSDALGYYIFDRSEMSGDAVKGMPIGLTCGVKGMWVWIPRYKYAVPAGTDEREISVIFEHGTNTTGFNTETGARANTLNNLVDSDYYTHPGFNYGETNTPYTGLWIGKFTSSVGSVSPRTETSNSTSTAVYIRPDFASSVYQKSYYEYATALLIDTNHDIISSLDTRPTRNIEWATMIPLTMSKYGKYGNSDYSGANKEVYFNNSTRYLTGRSAGVPQGDTTPATSTYGTYTYDDGTVSSSGTIDRTLATRQANATKGTGASTTGNIYGVYDVSGGAYDRQMAVLTASGSTAFNASSHTAGSGWTTLPESWLFDNYPTISSTIKGDFINGDGTAGWYSDHVEPFTNANHFTHRKIRTGYSYNSGIFATNTNPGTAASHTSFRAVFHGN